MDAFLVSLVMVFLAELGDKTQLVALVLAGKYKPSVVLWGILVATGAAHVVSVVGGMLLGGFLSGPWIPFLAGISFLVFGIWTLRGDSADDDGIRSAATPFLVVFWTFLLAEMGDKTMLATVSLAAQYRASANSEWLGVIPVWIGSTLGMVLSDALAVGVGSLLGARLPEKATRMLAAVVFLLFGAWSTWFGGRDLSPTAWLAGAAALVVCAFLLFRGSILSRE